MTLGTAHYAKQDREEVLANLFSARTERLVFSFVTALRLHKEGLVSPGPIVLPLFKGSEPMLLTPEWLNISSYDYTFEEPRVFKLLATDLPAINAVMADVNSWRVKRDPKNMQVALTRFHSSYGGGCEERIIDQMVAFETICLEDEQELKYRLALRVACLVGRDAKTKITIFKDMRHAYKLRSDIVHGDTDVDDEEVESILPKTEEYLRVTIRKFLSLLSRGYKFAQIRPELLDKNILDTEMHL
ncbi:MAG: hypothetical protein JRN22_00475 [Nitrososphaerota archaeon]|nr:hypothetical protein [Nitrososphaerota archaeon]